MQERWVHELDAGRRERVQLDVRGGWLQQPGTVRYLCGDEPACAQREQAIALAEPVFQRTGTQGTGTTDRLIARDERVLAVNARVVDAPAMSCDDHPRQPIGEAVKAAADGREQRARGVECQEPDAGPPIDRDVRPHVQLGNRAQPARWKEAAGARIGHPEGDDSHPRPAVAHVGLDPARQQRTERTRLDRPMCEEKVVPALGEKSLNHVIKAYD